MNSLPSFTPHRQRWASLAASLVLGDLALAPVYAAAPALLPGVNRIAFLGDSITQGGGAEQLFPAQGAEIRNQVAQRLKIRFDAWMIQIGHGRPGVSGGPKAKPGPSVAQATSQCAEITQRIQAVLPAKAAPLEKP